MKSSKTFLAFLFIFTVNSVSGDENYTDIKQDIDIKITSLQTQPLSVYDKRRVYDMIDNIDKRINDIQGTNSK
jgi:hypothetical protein